MEKIYLSQEKFERLVTKGNFYEKKVFNFPNKTIKKIGNIVYHIIPDGVSIEVNQISEEEKKSYCGVYTDEDVVELSLYNIGFRTMGWFPTELVAGTLPRKLGHGIVREGFSMNTPLSKETGWLEKTGDSGSFTAFFLKSKVDVAISILRDNGFKFL